MTTKNQTLLIVDDEPDILEGLKTIFSGLVTTVYTAENGLEGLAVIDAHPISCIISDIKMPKLDGVGMIREIHNRNLSIPVIFYTGHGNEDLMREVAKYGAFDFVDKPDVRGLQEVVRRGLAAGVAQENLNEDEADLSQMLDKLKDID